MSEEVKQKYKPRYSSSYEVFSDDRREMIERSVTDEFGAIFRGKINSIEGVQNDITKYLKQLDDFKIFLNNRLCSNYDDFVQVLEMLPAFDTNSINELKDLEKTKRQLKKYHEIMDFIKEHDNYRFVLIYNKDDPTDGDDFESFSSAIRHYVESKQCGDPVLILSEVTDPDDFDPFVNFLSIFG